MRFKVFIVAFTAVSLAAAVATAGLVPVLTQVCPPNTFVAPEAGIDGAFTSYQLSIETDGVVAGELISGIDVSLTSAQPIFMQRWSGDADFDGNADPTPNAVTIADRRGDSHLTAPAGSIVIIPYAENNLVDTASKPDTWDGFSGYDYGLGDSLSAVWGVSGGATTVNIAYIVIPTGMEAQVSLALDVSTSEVPVTSFTAMDFGLAVPEPASITLFGLAVVGLVGFVRRR